MVRGTPFDFPHDRVGGEPHVAAGPEPAAAELAPDRHTVYAAGHALAVWSRRAADPHAAVVLVHGRTWSARTVFDFEPRAGSRSLLKSFAAAGFAAYAVDLRGYGATDRDQSGWLTPGRAVADVEAVLRFVTDRHPHLAPPVVLGWSRGAKIAALLAARARAPLGGLILYGFTFDPHAPPAHAAPAGAAPAAPNSAADARSDFISPAVASPELIADFVAAALRADPVMADVCNDAEFLQIRPDRLRVPTLLIHGEADPGIEPQAAAGFFLGLGCADRRWIVIGGADHAAHLEDTAPAVAAAMIEFVRAAAHVDHGVSLR
jgi:alpha-beta hydrolase superfamily lysophospholipase